MIIVIFPICAGSFCDGWVLESFGGMNLLEVEKIQLVELDIVVMVMVVVVVAMYGFGGVGGNIDTGCEGGGGFPLWFEIWI